MHDLLVIKYDTNKKIFFLSLHNSPEALYVTCMHFFSKVWARLHIRDRSTFRYADFKFLGLGPENFLLMPFTSI